MSRSRLFGLALLASFLSPAAGSRPAVAEGAALNGLMAPEFTVPAGLNGAEAGTTLSSMRGRVVWIKFWLRDCPRCRKTLPAAQEMHELYAASGLVVLTVVHQHGPDQVRPFLQQQGYTFPVACDSTGALAQLYQVNNRPTDYLIGVDGRVMVSNGAPEDAVLAELSRQRVVELGRLPAGLENVRRLVEGWDYGAAVKEARKVAGLPDAAPEVRDAAGRVEALAGRRLDIDLERANVLWRRKRLPEARALFGSLAAGYADTTQAAKAKSALDAFLAAQGG